MLRAKREAVNRMPGTSGPLQPEVERGRQDKTAGDSRDGVEIHHAAEILQRGPAAEHRGGKASGLAPPGETKARRHRNSIIEDAFLAAGLKKVPRRLIPTLPKAPGIGEFCGESKLGASKADFILRLYDDRVMAVECKASNSALNSVKRLNHEAASKAEKWRRDFGETQIVPVAVISGVFKQEKLEDAQRRGLTIFWSHKLGRLVNWILRTKQS